MIMHDIRPPQRDIDRARQRVRDRVQMLGGYARPKNSLQTPFVARASVATAIRVSAIDDHLMAERDQLPAHNFNPLGDTAFMSRNPLLSDHRNFHCRY